MKGSRAYIIDVIVFWTTVLFFVFLSVFLFAGYVGQSTLHFKNSNKRFLSTVFPEGWSFFTKGKPENVIKLYRVTGSDVTREDVRPFSYHYAFGLDRKYELLKTELLSITEDSSKLSIFKKYVLPAKADKQLGRYVHADTLQFNDIMLDKAYILKGKVIISMQHFATWQEARKGIEGPVTIIPLNIMGR